MLCLLVFSSLLSKIMKHSELLEISQNLKFSLYSKSAKLIFDEKGDSNGDAE